MIALQSFLFLVVVLVLHVIFKCVVFNGASTDQQITQANVANGLVHLNAIEGFAFHRAQHHAFCSSLCCALFVVARVVATIRWIFQGYNRVTHSLLAMAAAENMNTPLCPWLFLAAVLTLKAFCLYTKIRKNSVDVHEPLLDMMIIFCTF